MASMVSRIVKRAPDPTGDDDLYLARGKISGRLSYIARGRPRRVQAPRDRLRSSDNVFEIDERSQAETRVKDLRIKGLGSMLRDARSDERSHRATSRTGAIGRGRVRIPGIEMLSIIDAEGASLG